MLEKLKRKNINKEEKQIPINIEQLIEYYGLEKIWEFIDEIIDYLKNLKIEETTGDTGIGIPKGGEQGQVLAKTNDADYNTEWVNIFNKIYPVGAIYMSATDVKPSVLFGGTWERIKDTFLLAAGDVYANGTTGGEATHTLTENEMPSHKHKNFVGQTDGTGTYSNNLPQSAWTNKNYWNYYETDAVGGGQPHNNMPPYLAVYVWKRTA